MILDSTYETLLFLFAPLTPLPSLPSRYRAQHPGGAGVPSRLDGWHLGPVLPGVRQAVRQLRRGRGLLPAALRVRDAVRLHRNGPGGGQGREERKTFKFQRVCAFLQLIH